jgi:hypothetical protein
VRTLQTFFARRLLPCRGRAQDSGIAGPGHGWMGRVLAQPGLGDSAVRGAQIASRRWKRWKRERLRLYGADEHMAWHLLTRELAQVGGQM